MNENKEIPPADIFISVRGIYDGQSGSKAITPYRHVSGKSSGVGMKDSKNNGFMLLLLSS